MREGYTQTAAFLKRFNLRSAPGKVSDRYWRNGSKQRHRRRGHFGAGRLRSRNSEAFQWVKILELSMNVECSAAARMMVDIPCSVWIISGWIVKTFQSVEA
jgi:hypothetical protein